MVRSTSTAMSAAAPRASARGRVDTTEVRWSIRTRFSVFATAREWGHAYDGDARYDVAGAAARRLIVPNGPPSPAPPLRFLSTERERSRRT